MDTGLVPENHGSVSNSKTGEIYVMLQLGTNKMGGANTKYILFRPSWTII